MTPFTRRDLLRSGIVVSASSLLPVNSIRGASQPIGEASRSPFQENTPALAPREHLLLDFDWKFFQGNAADPARDLDFGKNQGDFAKSGEFEFATAKFDDSKWRALNLPHYWAVELPFVH